MVSQAANRANPRSLRRFFRVSLRTWLLIVTLFCVAVSQGYRIYKRNQLEAEILSRGSLVYEGRPRHSKSVTMSSSRGLVVGGPQPAVGLRDGNPAWVSKWSGGSVAFCKFDSLHYSVSNVPMPDWINDILATGELRTVFLRSNNERIKLSLLMKCRELEELGIAGGTYQADMLSGIHRLQKLKKLSLYQLDRLQWDQVHPEGFPPNLVEISMSECNLMAKDMEILKNCRKLKTLRVSRNLVNLQALADVGLPPDLEYIDLSSTAFVKEDLALLAECRRLKNLNLSSVNADFRGLDGMPLPESLEDLRISASTLDASTFRWFSRLKNLRSLKISACRFEDADAEGIRLSAKLRDFYINGFDSGPNIVRMLADADELKSLTLSSERIDDDVLKLLGDRPALEDLVLRGATITDASGDWLRTLRKLKRLDLRRTKVSDALFKSAPQLRYIDTVQITETQVSAELQKEIRDAENQRWREQRQSTPRGVFTRRR